MRHILERFRSTLFLAGILAGSCLASDCADAARTPRETIAYVPAAIWGSLLDQSAGELRLDRNAIYWFDGARGMGRVIGDRERYEATDAKAAPREAMVAFVGRFAVYPSNTLVSGVAVMDTTGIMLADFPRGLSYAWSPDGARLAVLFAKEPLPRGRARRGKKAVVRYRPGVTIWDRQNGAVRTFDRWPSRVAWAGNDSLLLQLPDSVAAIDMRSGKIVATEWRGTILSPDARYALWPGEGGQNTRLFHEPADTRIEDDVFGAFRERDLGQVRSAFWVRARGAAHLMCVSACDGIQLRNPLCRTEVIDVATGRTVDSFPGEALGPTADERGVVVFRRSRGRLEYHDLRPVAREWSEDRARWQRVEANGEPGARDEPGDRDRDEGGKRRSGEDADDRGEDSAGFH